MRDVGEPPIHRVLRPDHYEEYRTTCNLTERRKGRKSGRSGGRREGKKRGRTLEKYKVSDSREEGE
jgi:hypothetical protein